jgi:thiamine-monophosphate kinase
VSETEFQIIERYFSRATTDTDVAVGIGDDAAIVNVDGALAVAVDTLVEGVHFPRGLPAEAIGYRVLAVNLSDLAAMGAVPRWCTLALTLPEAETPWLKAFAEGLFGLADRFAVSLIGGDLTRGPLTATLQILGLIPGDGRALRRGGGHAGDEIYVTGTLGDSAAGLALLGEPPVDGRAERAVLQERFLWPTPRVAEGQAISTLASAAIDVSDGLVADLGHICMASGCGAELEIERLPLSGELLSLFPPNVAEAYALGGGDDYELCFTAAPAQAAPIEAALGALGASARKIGRLVAAPGVVCLRDGERVDPRAGGYRHF